MAAVGPSELLIVIAMFFSGGFGLPLGIPPGPEDELLARVAPDQCLFYTAWAGMAKPDPQSPNQTEQLMAEAEIQQLVATLDQQLGAAWNHIAERERNPASKLLATAGPRALKTLLTHPAAIFVGDLQAGDGPPKIQAGMIVNAGDEIDRLRSFLEQLQARVPQDRVQEVTEADLKLNRILLPPPAPPVSWGVRGKYLIVGLGEGTVAAMLDKARSDPPKWLTDLRRRLPVERRSTVTYLNLGRVRELVGPLLAREPQVAAALQALGLDGLQTVGCIGGLDKNGFISRTWIGLEGEPRGLFALAAADPLKAEDLTPIPEDALGAVAFKLNLEQVLDLTLQVAAKVQRRAAEDIERGMGQISESLGFHPRNDLLPALGDAWTLYASPSEGGLLTGLTATVAVRDRVRLGRIHDQLLNAARREFGSRERSPQIRQLSFAGNTIYYLYVPHGDFPLSPAWCLTEDHLVVALFPQALKSYLTPGDGFRSLAQAKPVAELLADGTPPIKLAYLDTRSLFRLVYPLLQIGMHVGLHEAQRQGLDLDPVLMPSLGCIDRHLEPCVVAVRRTEGGLEAFTRQTLPGGSVGAAAPVAVGLLLPAVQAAREAARRAQSMNNLKQIGLALHIYHDAHQAFPAAFSVDEQGRPLLSWRVHILPYIDQQALYREFRLNEPWDSEHNRKLAETIPSVYRSPGSESPPGMTVYLGVSGEGRVFVPPKPDGPRQGAPLGVRLPDITDGTSNTVAVVEANDASAVPWTKPDDYQPKDEDPLRGLVGLRPGGFSALFCDGSVRFISQAVDRTMLKRLFTISDGEPVTLP